MQSTAALVLAVQGQIDFPVFLFANVGDDSEHPKTLAFVRDVAMPYAAAHGIELLELRKRTRNGESLSLIERIDRTESSIPIPARMSNGAPGNRTCTDEFKIKVIAKELRARGATGATPAVVGIGISVDEFERANVSRIPAQIHEHPLIDLRIDRQDAKNIIAAAGLAVPPKSSCYFCPFHRVAEWKRMQREEPDLFAASAALEQKLIDRRARLGKDPVYLTRYARPLLEAIGPVQEALFEDDDNCESGFCMT